MDNDDLTNLADQLERRGLTIARCDPEQRIHVSNPLSSHLAEEITLRGNGYYPGFDYEVGERGDETACAARIAYMLGAPSSKEAAQ